MSNPSLPDITSSTRANRPAALQWVGMDAVALPLQLAFATQPNQLLVAHANTYVNLIAADVKGIHMSRLYALINDFSSQPCEPDTLTQLLNAMVDSQQGIASAAKVVMSAEVLLKKPALLTQNAGYQSYPVTIVAETTSNTPRFTLELAIPYSSTCPCSAALSRQLYAQALDAEFPGETINKERLLEWAASEDSSIATPHSQRSFVYLQLAIEPTEWPHIDTLIFDLETAIATPVQTAVKRADEQAFANLNAQNLMFCEDAARRVKHTLEALPSVQSFWFKVEHQESLHAHNAVAEHQSSNHTFTPFTIAQQ